MGIELGGIGETYHEYHTRVSRLRENASFRGNPAKSIPPRLKPALNCRHDAGIETPIGTENHRYRTITIKAEGALEPNSMRIALLLSR